MLRLRMRGAIISLPLMSSWCGVYILKHRDNFAFALFHTEVAERSPPLLMGRWGLQCSKQPAVGFRSFLWPISTSLKRLFLANVIIWLPLPVTTTVLMKRMATWLEGNMWKYTAGGSETAQWRCGRGQSVGHLSTASVLLILCIEVHN